MQIIFERGQNVIVERTSGAVETGWTVVGMRGDRTTVAKDFHGEQIIKSPTTDELATWQVTHIDAPDSGEDVDLPTELRERLHYELEGILRGA